MRPLERLRRAFPWPAVRPAVEPSRRGWDGGGRHLVTEAIAAHGVRLVLEVGSFLGLSARTWLDSCPDLTVICLDPWPDLDVRQWGLHDWPELFDRKLYDVFLSSCWPYRERIIPYRGTSPAALRDLRARGVVPDLVYLDGDHSYQAVTTELTTCRRLFPEALLCGDDWTWTAEHFPPHSVREAVQDFAAGHGLEVVADGNTWRLDRRPGAARPVARSSWLPAWLGRWLGRNSA
jgi:hypothetical protein